MNYVITTNIEGQRMIFLSSQNYDNEIQYATEHKIEIFSFIGSNPSPSIEPLLSVKDKVKGLFLNKNLNLSRVAEFQNLTTLYMPNTIKVPLDMSVFKKLVTFSYDYSEKIINLENNSTIKNLTVNNYKSEKNNLTSLRLPTLLNNFSLIKSKIKSLSGIEKTNIKESLEILYCNELTEIDAVGILKDLRKIHFEKCKSITSYSILGILSNLEKIVLADSGSTSNLHFIEGLQKLKYFSFFGTNILDGNLSYCKKVANVAFDNKKHYSHKLVDFRPIDHF